HTGQEVEVMVLDVDEERRRISLGLKQCQANPWKEFAENYNKGDKVAGQIKSITDFGIFIGLQGNIDGLVHLSDISWDQPGEEAVRNYQKGQQRASELGRERVEDARSVLKVGDAVEAKFTGVDRKSRTISLSIKAKEAHEEAEAVQSYRSEAAPSGTSLGDLLKEHIGSGER